MWYHRMMCSEDTRIAKKILLEQMTETKNWYTEVREYALDADININYAHVTAISYNEYKMEVKKQLKKKIIKEIKMAKKTMKKLRYINPENEQEYIKICTPKEVKMIMKIRLNMINVKCNYKKEDVDNICRICKLDDKTTEHVLGCQTNHKMIFDTNRIEDIDWLRIIIKPYELFEKLNVN